MTYSVKLLVVGATILWLLFRVSQVLLGRFSARHVRSAGQLLGWFGSLRVYLRSFHDCQNVVEMGYRAYSKHGEVFQFDDAIDGHVYIVPHHLLQEFLSTSDEKLNTIAALDDSRLGRTTHLLPTLVSDPYFVLITRTKLTRALNDCLEEMNEEVVASFQDIFTCASAKVQKVTLYETAVRVIARTSSRKFVGEELCRNEGYIENIEGYAGDVMFSSFFLKALPLLIRKIVEPIVLLPNKRRHRTAHKYLDPIIERRMRLLEKGEDGDKPTDMLQWMLEQARRRPGQYSAKRLVPYMMVVNFVSLDSSAGQFTQLIFNLAAHPEATKIWEELRQEAISVLEANENRWTKQVLLDLRKTDSAIRESMRMYPFGSFVSRRKVVHKDGFTFSDGTHIRPGAIAAAPQYSIHHDEDFYHNANSYEPYRFLDMRASSSSDKDRSSHLASSQLSANATSTEWMPYGHGKHACPGRFFNAAEQKMMLVHLVRNFELVPRSRPENVWIGANLSPDRNATISFKRRREGDIV
ncbi:MAG: hypothetical protein M4579_004468 [Chaenotheca gracillima]|nr:MAG: hypothetical protein M4579_004468 [Chaenotheca gracillima]